MDHIEGEPCHDVEDCRLTDRHVQTLLDREADEIARHFTGTFSPETVRECVEDSYTQLAATARIRTHLPVLAARFARQRLEATAKNQGATVSDKPEVLFVCVHNAGRSQMAAALLDHHAAGRVTVRSAGSAPADTINPAVVEAMNELGLDLSKEFPKPLTTEAVQAADVVITMGCGDACPVFPGKRYLDWQLDDPAGKGIDAVRPIRDEIDRRVRALLDELVTTNA
ncbi:arsenate reductase ArsC [Amycolatopsis thermoflava]|uniref:arsenate reductase ArsC n=1 Tax=Amycolatopsis thermoflava TaxID=84480 RepID=UPI0038106B1E